MAHTNGSTGNSLGMWVQGPFPAAVCLEVPDSPGWMDLSSRGHEDISVHLGHYLSHLPVDNKWQFSRNYKDCGPQMQMAFSFLWQGKNKPWRRGRSCSESYRNVFSSKWTWMTMAMLFDKVFFKHLWPRWGHGGLQQEVGCTGPNSCQTSAMKVSKGTLG